MPPRFLTPLLILLGFAGAAPARDLQVDIEILHIGGLLAPDELAAMLESPKLTIEAHYQPTRLIEGVTARRERTLPIGSQLFAIPQVLSISGAQLERKVRGAAFRASEGHPADPSYRLQRLSLRVPIAAGVARPQPDLEVSLGDEVPKAGAHERALFGRYGAFELGLRLRTRWSDAPGAFTVTPLSCDNDIRALGNGQYRFRPSHRTAGLFSFLSPVVQSGIPAKPVAGQSHSQLRAPFPDPVAGWELSRNHLVQMTVAGQVVERLSVYAEQKGPAACRRTRAYEALFADGQAVAVTRSIQENECSANGDPISLSVEARWLDDGSLANYVSSSPQGSRAWHAFSADAGAKCSADAAPAAVEVEQLKSELQRLRAAALPAAGR